MTRAARAVPLAIVVLSFTVCAVNLWFQRDSVGWLHIVLLGGAYAILTGQEGNSRQRALRGFVVGLATSLVLVAIAIIVGWTTDRPHFFDDGGPIAALLVIEVNLGLPAAMLGVLFSAVGTPALRSAAKLRVRRSH